MIEILSAKVERWNVDGSFIISRGAKADVDVVVCEVTDGTHVGRGEGTPIYYEGETAELCAESILMRGKQRRKITREDLLDSMMEGAARNAVDCALWDLEAKQAGKPVWQIAGLPQPKPLVTAFTISLADPAKMEADAREAARTYKLLKCKLTGEGDRDRVAAVRKGAPDARLIVDANESWDDLDIEAEAHALAAFGVELIEQPVSAGEEDLLIGLKSPIPFCADESCHTHEDLDRLEGYQVVNIKLDKAGGLTEAMLLAEKARLRGLDVMIGCMLGTSLGIAPAFLLAQKGKWVDLDGALLLAKDRKGGLRQEAGMLKPGTLWGEG
jgi:L-alanine-DL-glutamate epimerase-like enolase superfamily enzyme